MNNESTTAFAKTPDVPASSHFSNGCCEDMLPPEQGTVEITAFRSKIVAPALVFSSLFLAGSCGTAISPPTDLPPANTECRSAVRAAVEFDQSTSMTSSGTAPVETEDLRPLVMAVAECGGALAVGFVREGPQPGMQKIAFPRLPLLPPAPVIQEGEQSYEFEDRVAAYDQLWLDHSNSKKKALEDNIPAIDRYLSKIDDLLARPAARGTDLNSALNAADLFLSEPAKDADAQKILIIVSDGLDNRHKSLRPFMSGARVLWVNSTSDDKVLSAYHAARFEDLSGAVSDVINNLNTGEAR